MFKKNYFFHLLFLSFDLLCVFTVWLTPNKMCTLPLFKCLYNFDELVRSPMPFRQRIAYFTNIKIIAKPKYFLGRENEIDEIHRKWRRHEKSIFELKMVVIQSNFTFRLLTSFVVHFFLVIVLFRTRLSSICPNIGLCERNSILNRPHDNEMPIEVIIFYLFLLRSLSHLPNRTLHEYFYFATFHSFLFDFSFIHSFCASSISRIFSCSLKFQHWAKSERELHRNSIVFSIFGMTVIIIITTGKNKNSRDAPFNVYEPQKNRIINNKRNYFVFS